MKKIHYWLSFIICIYATSCIEDSGAFNLSDTEWVSIDGGRIVFNADSTFYVDSLNLSYILNFRHEGLLGLEEYDSIASQISTSYKGIWEIYDPGWLEGLPRVYLIATDDYHCSFSLKFVTFLGHQYLVNEIGDPDAPDIVYRFYDINEFTP